MPPHIEGVVRELSGTFHRDVDGLEPVSIVPFTVVINQILNEVLICFTDLEVIELGEVACVACPAVTISSFLYCVEETRQFWKITLPF